jgi:hypothetical protein
LGRIQNGSAPLPASPDAAPPAAVASSGTAVGRHLFGQRGDRRNLTIGLRLHCIRHQRIERRLSPIENFRCTVDE